jgi:serine protease Do
VNISSKQSARDRPEVQYVLPPGSSRLESLLRNYLDNGKEAPSKATFLGSGIIVDAEGYVLTNYHIVADVDDLCVTLSDGTETKASLVGKDKVSDIAVLRIETKKTLTPAVLGDSDAVKVGEWVLAIGNPFGLGGNVSLGIVSHKTQGNSEKSKEAGIEADYIQTDAAICRNSLGGALFSAEGKVLGMITAVLSETGGNSGLNFAIPSNTLKTSFEQMRKFGRVKRGWLGVSVDSLSSDVAESLGLKKEQGGTVVVHVFPDSPAARAGLQTGDIIVEVDKKQVTDGHCLSRLVTSLPIGKAFSMKVLRNSKELTLHATAEDRESAEDGEDDAKILSKTPEGTYIPELGISIDRLSPDLARLFGIPLDVKEGVVVTKIKNSSNAGDKDVRLGDLITRVNQSPVANVEEFEKHIQAVHKERESVAFLVYRDGISFYRALSFKKKGKEPKDSHP